MPLKALKRVDFPGNGAASGEKLVFSMKHPEFSMEYGDFFLRNLVEKPQVGEAKTDPTSQTGDLT